MRDLILKIVTALEAIKTAVETIAVNTTPAAPADETEPANNG